jgi:hypothetical protein
MCCAVELIEAKMARLILCVSMFLLFLCGKIHHIGP